MTNCKNCGAPLHGGKCEYCGTEYDLISIEPIKPKIYPKSISVHENKKDLTHVFYADNVPYLTVDSIWYEHSNREQMDAMIDEVIKRWETKGVLYR